MKDDRSFIMYIILSVVTCGLYAFWFIHTLARDINTMCVGDGKRTGGLIAYIILSFLTFGLYHVYWKCKIAARLQENASRYGLHFSEGFGTILAWSVLGLFIVVGPFIATYILIRNTNDMARAYNQQH